MSAAESQDRGNSQEREPSKSISDIRLRDGLTRIRTSLAARGEPFAPDELYPIKELGEYFNRALFRLSAATFALKKKGHLPETDIGILEQDVQLVNEIGLLLLQVLGD
jgi:hypothetical protein